MGIAEDVAELQLLSQEKPLCKVGQVIAGLNDSEQRAINYAIDRARLEADEPQNRRIFTASVVHRLLVNNDHPVGITTVKDHLNRKCACDDRE